MPPTKRGSESLDRRTQAVLDQVAARIERLQIDDAIRKQIMDSVFDTTHAAVFRAVQSREFIERVITVYPTLTDSQKSELRAIADELLVIARNTSKEAYERGRQLKDEPLRPTRKPDPLDGLFEDLKAEWEALLADLEPIIRWIQHGSSK